MKGFQAIIFDLDGTLYDSREYHRGANEDVAKVVAERCGVDKKKFLEFLLKSYAEKTSHYGKHITDALAAFELDPELTKELRALHNRHAPTLTLYPGVVELLKLLHRQYRMGLLSDGEQDKQKRKIEHLQLRPFFDAMCITGEFGLGYHKPHPRGFEEIMRRLKLRRKHRMMHVGDNPLVDFAPAKLFGMITVRVLQGEFADVTPEEGQEADYDIEDIRQLPVVLAEEEDK